MNSRMARSAGASTRLGVIGEVEDRVNAADGFDRVEHRVARRGEAVLMLPLQEADPDDDLGQLLGVRVDLNAGQLRRADQWQEAHAASGRVADRVLFKIEQQIERDVEDRGPGPTDLPLRNPGEAAGFNLS